MGVETSLILPPAASLTLADLDVWARDLISRGALPGTAAFANAINTSIIAHFLGIEWYVAHASLNSPEKSYLHPEFDADGKAREWSILFLNLAEMLFNLQGVENFNIVLKHLTLDQLESALSELQSGMLLKQEGIFFRYLDPDTFPEGQASPDIELTLWDGSQIGAEVKSKSVETELTNRTIKRALDDGADKFQKGDVGIIIMRVPQSWTVQTLDGDVKLPQDLVRATDNFLRNSTRIAKIVYYCFHIAIRIDRSCLIRLALHEEANPKNASGSPWSRTLLKGVLDATKWTTIPGLVDRWTAAHARGLI